MKPLRLVRLRFTLRAMLVAMTLLALFLGHHLNWIHQRRDALRSGWIEDAPDPFLEREPDAPALLRLFGEAGHSGIYVKDNLDGDRQVIHRKAKALFPEAKLLYDADLGN